MTKQKYKDVCKAVGFEESTPLQDAILIAKFFIGAMAALIIGMTLICCVGLDLGLFDGFELVGNALFGR